MDENELTDRLRAMGDEPVPDTVRDEHLRRIASTPIEPGRGFGRVWIAAAAIVGFLVGSTGLAAAGALPDPAQDVAHDVLAVVQVDVPEGKRGPCVSAVAKSDLPKADKKAAKDACPKGGNGQDEDDTGAPGQSGSAPGQTKHADDPCRGKPPWAGNKGLTKAEKDAMKAERAAACGGELDDDDEDEIEEDDEGDEEVEASETDPEAESREQKSAPAPTTSAPATTSTTTSTTITETTTTTVAETSSTTAPTESED